MLKMATPVKFQKINQATSRMETGRITKFYVFEMDFLLKLITDILIKYLFFY